MRITKRWSLILWAFPSADGPDGLHAKPEDVPPDYPVRIDWNGILVGDSEHEYDIVRRVREVLEVIWKETKKYWEELV